MRRVVILGRGGAGKSTLARDLGEVTELPVIELDTLFWNPDLSGTAPGPWAARQHELVKHDAWILVCGKMPVAVCGSVRRGGVGRCGEETPGARQKPRSSADDLGF